MALRWAVLGCGDIANKRVAPAMVDDPNSELIAFFSNTRERAEQMRDRFGAARAYSDMDALMADEGVDAVYIASPHPRHLEETVACARAGKHVLCEKPMAVTVDECEQMIAACRENDVALAIAYYRRWYPKARAIKKLLDEGAIGTAVRARIRIGGWWSPDPEDWKYWRVTDKAGGGALMDVGSHRLDLICYWLGEPDRAAGLMTRQVMDFEVPDTETLICEMSDGTHLVCECQWNTRIGSDEMVIHGTDGSIVATPFDGPDLMLRTPDGAERIDLEPKAENVHLPLIASFSERVDSGKAPEFDGVDGMQASRIIGAAIRSHKTGRWERC